MTPEQRKWLDDNPTFSTVGPPRAVRFKQWGTLDADGQYTRLDNQRMSPIKVGGGRIGVGEIE